MAKERENQQHRTTVLLVHAAIADVLAGGGHLKDVLDDLT